MEIQCRRVVTLLGSRPGCKVTLKHKAVSPVHLAIVNDGEEVHAADLVTPSGTHLNGLKLSHEVLNDGDVLAFGPWEFRVDIPRSKRSGLSDAQPYGFNPTPQVLALEHITTQRILQPTRDVCIIGRRQGCDIVISDGRVSRVHALLFRYFGNPAVFDLLSSSSVLVNEVPCRFKLLENDDVLTVGDSRFQVRLAGQQQIAGAASDNGKNIRPIPLAPPKPPDDLIDIQKTEGSQRWRIAENARKAAHKQ